VNIVGIIIHDTAAIPEDTATTEDIATTKGIVTGGTIAAITTGDEQKIERRLIPPLSRPENRVVVWQGRKKLHSICSCYGA
jgi:hypothetical protein